LLSDAADLLGVPSPTCARSEQSAKGPIATKLGRLYFDRRDLDEWLRRYREADEEQTRP
jgi:hypothetical protein